MNKKIGKEEFLKLEISEQINLINNAIKEVGNTDGVSKILGFSYSWVAKKIEEQGVFYVVSLKKFIVEDKNVQFTRQEAAVIREIINNYESYKKENISDIRMVAGSCGEETVTRSIVIDTNVNDEWNDFCKKNRFINNKDLVTYALNEFMNKL